MSEMSQVNQKVAEILGVPDFCADFKASDDESIIATGILNGEPTRIKIHSDGTAYFLRTCGYEECEDPTPITQHGWVANPMFRPASDNVPSFTSTAQVSEALELLKTNKKIEVSEGTHGKVNASYWVTDNFIANPIVKFFENMNIFPGVKLLLDRLDCMPMDDYPLCEPPPET